MEEVKTLPMTKEQAKEFAHALIDKLIDCNDKGEYMSLSTNITAGPGEGPVAFIAFLPGTTSENAKRIQEGFLKYGAELNKD